MKSKKRDAIASKRAAKAQSMTEKPGSKSAYSRKQKLKFGSGKVYVGWMSWAQAEGAPVRELTTERPRYS